MNLNTKTSAEIAQFNSMYRKFALKVTEFTTCKLYDFADGSFLIVHDNGRTEVNHFYS